MTLQSESSSHSDTPLSTHKYEQGNWDSASASQPANSATACSKAVEGELPNVCQGINRLLSTITALSLQCILHGEQSKKFLQLKILLETRLGIEKGRMMLAVFCVPNCHLGSSQKH